MKPFLWEKLKEKLFFSTEDVANAAGGTGESSNVLCSRYGKKGTFIKLKKNFYILEQIWERYTQLEFFKIANFLQVPSYISCMSALSYYGITTQIQRNWYESISLRRSAKFEAKGTVFNYYKIRKEFYFGFLKEENFFIATREKAFLDAVYLHSFGKYPLDLSSIDVNSFDNETIVRLTEPYPQRTQQKIKEICRI